MIRNQNTQQYSPSTTWQKKKKICIYLVKLIPHKEIICTDKNQNIQKK